MVGTASPTESNVNVKGGVAGNRNIPRGIKPWVTSEITFGVAPKLRARRADKQTNGSAEGPGATLALPQTKWLESISIVLRLVQAAKAPRLLSLAHYHLDLLAHSSLIKTRGSISTIQ